jgi:uncharacterized membrane protein
MHCDRMPGPAFWAIVLTAALLLTATIAGYLSGDSWNTISDMITRSPRLRNAFSLFVGVIVVCQGFYVYEMHKHWTQRAALYKTHNKLRGTTAIIALGYLASLGGSVGFAIVSTDIDKSEHVVYAGTAFIGIYVFLVAFTYLAFYYQEGNGTCNDEHGKGAYWPLLAGISLDIPVLALIVYAISDAMGEPLSHDYDYVWEFIFVACMLVASLCLYIESQDNLDGNRTYQPVKFGWITLRDATRRESAGIRL